CTENYVKYVMGERKMKIKFNEKKVKDMENSKIREKSLKYRVDTVFAFYWLLSAAGFLILAILISMIPIGSLRMPFMLSIAGMFFSVITAVRHFSGINYNKLKNMCRSAALNFDEVERDCEAALNFSGTPCIIGNRYIIISEKIISFEKVCWVFYGFKTVNNNGATVKRGSITVCFDDGTVSECIMKENKAAVFLNEVHRKHPEVILGFSFELEKLFRTNISEFRNLSVSMRPDSIYDAKSDEINN
ncbi:MAG: DUF6709 family protein, partial [Huintestinicola sp.]